MISHSLTTTIPFTKMHGLGNDFIMLKGETLPSLDLKFLSNLAKAVCDRHFGIGGDGLIINAPPTDATQFDVQFLYFNSDGSQAEMCGNGIRCFALFLLDEGILKQSTFTVETPAGAIKPQVNADRSVRVDMGMPILSAQQVPFTPLESQAGYVTNAEPALLNYEKTNGTLVAYPISMGNPHCIVFDDVTGFDALVPSMDGPALESHPQFPKKTNVEFTTKLNDTTFKVVVWERGCGFTLACGTGACATGVAAILSGRTTASKVEIQLPGGSLWIEWAGTATDSVFMTGPATVAFKGELPSAWVTEAFTQ
jgi:diaminopimelate epimerase